ncbi:MAG: UDP-N-acetylglucosamine 2-epimerase (non-hydrolyzing) [Capsulimonadaceae bacterium]|nr:UDP-N-acetylglucosamine 2-epimerase (non-hydrolyzing) [Capsulimonadaceae bacterium]
MKHKIITVFGTRPDAIKMAPVVKALQRRSDACELRVAVTGQHREMLDQVLRAFDIVPDHDLAIMAPGQTLAGITARAMTGLDAYFAAEKPDAVIAQGDTTTTFVAALAAFYHRAAFGHVEAGLRTGNKFDPFPEEMNRLLTTRLTTLHFPPTQEAAENLRAEKVAEETIVVTGNTVIDALLATAAKEHAADDPAVSEAIADPRRVILVTAHRRENWGEPMARICRAIRDVATGREDVLVVFSLHRNPVVRETVVPILGDLPNVRLIEPPDYVPFVKLMQKATLILTDSGGVQEEAPSLAKPVLVMRETTERPEGLTAGVTRLVGTDIATIVRETNTLLDDPAAYDRMARSVSPYGDGHAADRIVDSMLAYLRSR